MVDVLDLLSQGLLRYSDVDCLQREVWEEVRGAKRDHTLIVAQFESVYTAGRNTHSVDILNPDLPVVWTDRAGSVTWHGPGQLVVYPVVRLKEPVDLGVYIRSVEAAVLESIQRTWDLPVETIQGRAGVWMRYRDASGQVNSLGRRDRKICAIGLKVAQGTSLHGVALNVSPDFSEAFTGIIPCGLADAGVTSLREEGVETDLVSAAGVVTERLCHHLSPLLG